MPMLKALLPSSTAQHCCDTGTLFTVPSCVVHIAEELSATRQLWDAAAAPEGRPLIIFNGELDRLRGGYYPGEECLLYISASM